jgi:hypothetical protein
MEEKEEEDHAFPEQQRTSASAHVNHDGQI